MISSQSGYDPQEDSAKFGYKLKMKVKFLNVHIYCFLNIWTLHKILAIFYQSQIPAIEKAQKAIDFST